MPEPVPSAIRAIVDRLEGEVSLAARDLRTGRTILLHPDRLCPTASVIKLPILVHTVLLAQEGHLSLDEPVLYAAEEKTPGSGILKDLTPGLQLPLRDLCTLMIALSDNTATNLVLDRVGVEPVNMRMQALGFRHTRLFRKVFSQGPPVSRQNARYGLGVTTPRDMIRLLSALYFGTIGSRETSELVRTFLRAQQGRDGIPRYLPPEWTYEGKGGAVNSVRNDVGIVADPDGLAIALAIFCTDMPRPLWTADNPGWIAIGRLARAIVQNFHPELAT